MCRWLAYSGSPILIEELLYKPRHSLIDQSRHARLGVDTTNGDGFGVGWYSPDIETPAVFHLIKRDLALAVDESLFASIEGSTDSEMMFYLALTFGLDDDPPNAVERMVGHVEEVGRRHGTEHPIQMTIGTTDGNSVWGFRYSSEGKSRTLYYSTDMRSVQELYPDRQRLQELSEETRIVVSEPLVDLPGAWNEVPESSYGVVREGDDELRPFRPVA